MLFEELELQEDLQLFKKLVNHGTVANFHYPEYELYLLLHYHCIKKRPCFSWFQFTMQSIRPISRSFGSSDGIISTWRSKYCSKFLYSKYTIRLNEGGRRKSMKRKKRGKIFPQASELETNLSLSLSFRVFIFDFSPHHIFACISEEICNPPDLQFYELRIIIRTIYLSF